AILSGVYNSVVRTAIAVIHRDKTFFHMPEYELINLNMSADCNINELKKNPRGIFLLKIHSIAVHLWNPLGNLYTLHSKSSNRTNFANSFFRHELPASGSLESKIWIVSMLGIFVREVKFPNCETKSSLAETATNQHVNGEDGTKLLHSELLANCQLSWLELIGLLPAGPRARPRFHHLIFFIKMI
ncbi:hypothetical protein ACJX0J_024229, partial [Zea mays]